MEKYFCIFGGGGIRGAAYTGAIKALKDLDIEITGLAGSSIGAAVSGLLTFGYSPDEMQEVFNSINFEFFKDLNINFGKDFALSKGNNFYEWIKNKIEDKYYADSNVKEKPPVCFKDIDKELVILTVDLTTSKLCEFSKAKTPDVEIAQAIRTSVGMPGLYAPVFNEDECLVDGDLLKSMPLWKASDTIMSREEKILEFRLESNETKKKILNTVDYLNAVYDSVSGIASDNVISLYGNCDKFDYVKINSDGVSVVDFMINAGKKKEMAKNGYQTTIDYFKNKYPEKQKKLQTIYGGIFSSLNKILYMVKSKEFNETRQELLNVFEMIIDEKEILDKQIVSDIISYKKLFDANYVIKNGLFTKKPALINYDNVVNSLSELLKKTKTKIKV